MKNWSLYMLGILGCSVPYCVQSQKVIADKIIAQVGDQIVLKSDVDNEIADARRNEQQPGAPKLPPNIECLYIGNHLMQKALMIQAQVVDSLPLSDDELEGQLDLKMRQAIMYFGSREAFEMNMGKTAFQFKEEMRPRIKEQTLAGQERSKIVGGVKITPEEVQKYYDGIPKDSLPFYESELEISQIILHPKAGREVKDIVASRLIGFKRDIESGKYKFQDLARNYSEDPGVKENGGQYSINRIDKTFDPVFTSAAFRLKEGQISPVVETQFGLHLIQMVSKVGDDAVVRHILLQVPVSQIEVKEAVDSLDSIRKDIVAKRLSFSAAVSYFSDDKIGKMSGGSLVTDDGSSHIAYDQIQDKDMLKILDTLKVGEVSLPQAFTDNSEQGKAPRPGVRILYLRSKTTAHRENLRDDFDKVSARALYYKQQNALNDWFHDHIGNFYIHVDKDLHQCDNLSDWVNASERLEKE